MRVCGVQVHAVSGGATPDESANEMGAPAHAAVGSNERGVSAPAVGCMCSCNTACVPPPGEAGAKCGEIARPTRAPAKAAPMRALAISMGLLHIL
jgi:hypothetical protein